MIGVLRAAIFTSFVVRCLDRTVRTMLDKLKTLVGQKTARAGVNALTSQSTASNPSSLQEMFAQAAKMSSKFFEEREWQCPCGHKFRAGGDWVACAPIYCEVPNCPNPKYYVDGPGRALLEANPQGVRLQEVKPGGGHLPPSSNSPSSNLPPSATPKNSMGRIGKK